MIQQMIRRLFGKKDRLSQPVHKKKQPTPVEKTKHHIDPQLISKNAIKVTKTLQDAGYLAYIVGGAVRDLLLGITPKDFDVATNATPDLSLIHI
jgi:poly(A) polymerase